MKYSIEQFPILTLIFICQILNSKFIHKNHNPFKNVAYNSLNIITFNNSYLQTKITNKTKNDKIQSINSTILKNDLDQITQFLPNNTKINMNKVDANVSSNIFLKGDELQLNDNFLQIYNSNQDKILLNSVLNEIENIRNFVKKITLFDEKSNKIFDYVCKEIEIFLKIFRKVNLKDVCINHYELKSDSSHIIKNFHFDDLKKNILTISQNLQNPKYEPDYEIKNEQFYKNQTKNFTIQFKNQINNTLNLFKTNSSEVIAMNKSYIEGSMISSKLGEENKSQNKIHYSNSLFDDLEKIDENEKRLNSNLNFRINNNSNKDILNIKNVDNLHIREITKNEILLNENLRKCEKKFLNFRYIISKEKSGIELEKYKLRNEVDKISKELDKCNENKKYKIKYQEPDLDNLLKIEKIKKAYSTKLTNCMYNKNHYSFMLMKCKNELDRDLTDNNIFSQIKLNENKIDRKKDFSFLEENDKYDSISDGSLSEKLKQLKNLENEENIFDENMTKTNSNEFEEINEKNKYEEKNKMNNTQIDLDHDIPYYLKRLENPFFLSMQKKQNLNNLTEKVKKNILIQKQYDKFKEFLKVEELKYEIENINKIKELDLEQEKLKMKKIKELRDLLKDQNISRLNNEMCWDIVFDMLWTKIKK